MCTLSLLGFPNTTTSTMPPLLPCAPPDRDDDGFDEDDYYDDDDDRVATPRARPRRLLCSIDARGCCRRLVGCFLLRLGPAEVSSTYVRGTSTSTRAARRLQNGKPACCRRLKPKKNLSDTWLILPVVICLSQSLSHASVSSRHALERAKPRMAQEPDLILGTVFLLGGDG